jgi:hypothetical protein
MKQPLNTLYVTGLIFSLIFAFVGFSYNVWRMEQSEYNSNIRTASFEILKELARVERIVYAMHYDRTESKGNARDVWVAIGLIEDLNIVADDRLLQPANELKITWSENWQHVNDNEQAVKKVITATDTMRSAVHQLLRSLD